MIQFGNGNIFLYALMVIVIVQNLISGQFNLLNIVLSLPAVLIAITFHEYAHAKVAVKLGDNTPKMQGRLSLNPFAHLDPFGIIMLIFANIGWGKPVEINSNNFTKKIFNKKVSARGGDALTSIAGPMMNFIIAIVSAIIIGALYKFAPTVLMAGNGIGFIMLSAVVTMNVGLGVFNLIPLPPLDGSKVLMYFLPTKAQIWMENHEQLFMIIFLVIWITPIASYIISPAVTGLTNLIIKLVGLIFGIYI